MKNKKLNINRDWYTNRNVRPKRFVAEFERQPDSTYRVTGAVVEATINQHETRYQRIDARDFTQNLRNSPITVL